MRTAAFALLAMGAPAAAGQPREAEVAFKDFVTKYNRKYETQEEEAKRFKIFESNFEFINAENANERSYVLTVNQFADQAPEEFRTTHFGLSVPAASEVWGSLPRLGVDEYSGGELPTSIDWATKGAVTPLKNQGTCGSCWSFSTTGAVEGAWQIKTGKLVSLSEQQLIDCSKDNSGCGGGSMDAAFKYLKDQALCTEESYPYKMKQGTCPADGMDCEVGLPKGSLTGYYDVPASDTKALMEAVAQQPVSVGIEADQAAFQAYSSGILTKNCGSKLDHGVLVVGYGTDKGTDYWKVKNSWGATWGEDGYVRIERGLPGDGECGIKAMASYPEVTSSGPVPAPTPAPLPPAPTPAPTPSGCQDAVDYCKDKDIFTPAKDCPLIAFTCKKTCGCCSSTPKDWCNASVAGAKTVIV